MFMWSLACSGWELIVAFVKPAIDIVRADQPELERIGLIRAAQNNAMVAVDADGIERFVSAKFFEIKARRPAIGKECIQGRKGAGAERWIELSEEPVTPHRP